MADSISSRTKCVHKAQVHKADIIWSIDDFSNCLEKEGDFIESSLFSSCKDEGTKWKLRLYPFGNTEANATYVSLYLHLENTNQEPVMAKFMICFIHSNGIRGRCFKSPSIFAFKKNSAFGDGQFLHRHTIFSSSEILINGRLNIYCEVEVQYEQEMTVEIDPYNPFTEQATAKGHGFLLLFQTKLYSDVIFICEDKMIKAHKNILCDKSAVFESLFKDKISNKFEVKDMAHQTFVDMLEYIYVGNVPSFGDHIKDLLKAANRFAVESLKLEIENLVIKNIDIGNACEWLMLSDANGLNDAKALLMDFVLRDHLDSLSKSESWQYIVHSTKLYCECFKFVLENHQCFKK